MSWKLKQFPHTYIQMINDALQRMDTGMEQCKSNFIWKRTIPKFLFILLTIVLILLMQLGLPLDEIPIWD